MKKIMKLSLVIFVICTVLSLTAFASDFDHTAESLSELGLFRGTGNGFELDREPTRAEAATMLVRLLGAEEEAMSLTYTATYTDVYDWAKPYVQYLYEKGLTKGISETMFGYSDKCTSQQYATFLLRALGYSDGEGGDFTYENALSFAREKGVADGVNCNGGSFLRDNVCAMSYTALSASPKSGERDLLTKLISSGAIKDAKGQDKLFENHRNFTKALNLLESDRVSRDMKLVTEERVNGILARTTTQTVKAASVADYENPDNSRFSYVGNVEIKLSDEYADALDIPKAERKTSHKVEYYYKDGSCYINTSGEKVKSDVSVDAAGEKLGGMNIKPAAVPLSAIKELKVEKKSDGTTEYTAILYADAMSKVLDSEDVKFDAIEYRLGEKNGTLKSYGTDITVAKYEDGIKITEKVSAEITNLKFGNNVTVTFPNDLSGYASEKMIAEGVEVVFEGEFSWQEESGRYKKGTPGVRFDGFANTTATKIQNFKAAAERAATECKVKYNAVDVYYDSKSEMWKVCFFEKLQVGGDITVYMNDQGITHLVVAGE